jgi:hypothetical protein
MATFTKRLLESSTDGLAVKVTGISTAAANTVHTTAAGTSSLDEVWIYANNTSATATKLTIEWGTAVAADGNIEITIAAEAGLVLVIPGLVLTNSKTVKAFAATGSVILLTGYVNRVTY